MVVAPLVAHPARFQAGQLLMTAAVSALVAKGTVDPWPYLTRHLHGDWGDIGPQDARANQAALRDGNQLFSAYQVAPELRIWIITDWDRSRTTLMLPDDYEPFSQPHCVAAAG